MTDQYGIKATTWFGLGILRLRSSRNNQHKNSALNVKGVFVCGGFVGEEGLFIWFAYTFCIYRVWVFGLGKVFRSFRFEPELYAEFVRVVGAGGLTITGAFERFMRGCVEANTLVFVVSGFRF